MKKYAMLFMVSIFMFSLSVDAQPATPPQKRDGQKKELNSNEKPQISAQKRAGHLAVDLELSDAQRAKVQLLFEKQDKIRAERHAEMKKLKEQEKARFESERKAQDAEMEQIIGAEKFQQLKAKQAQRIEKMKDRRQACPNDSNARLRKGGHHGPKSIK